MNAGTLPSVAERNSAPTWPYLVALVAMCFVSRLPQLLSPNLLVDGDEAVLGLMAKHVAAGKEFPVFFYGQHYGLSTFEAGAAALVFFIFGVGAARLKLAMLALWTAGVVFLFLALAKMLGTRRGFWLTAIFVLMPMWAVWSMKARGGYLTSFAAMGAVLWILVQDRERQTPARWLAAGALTVIIYLAQPLWLPGLLPIVLTVLLLRRSAAGAASYFAVIIVAVALFRTSGGPTIGNADVYRSLAPVARQIYVTLTGSYYLAWDIEPPGIATKSLAVLWTAVLAATVLLQLYRLLTKRYLLWSHLLFVSLWATIATELRVLQSRDPRYLLPIAALLVMLAGIELVDLIDRRLVPRQIGSAVTALALVLGAASMWEFRSFSFLWPNPPNSLSESERLRRVVTYLNVEGVKDVFSMNGLLDTQLIFYGNENVISRYAMLRERYLPYVDEADAALARGERVAVVGYTSASGVPGCSEGPICTGDIEHIVSNPETLYTVDGKYFVYVGAGRALLERLGFRFPD